MAPTGQFLHDVARGLAARGHGVRVLCSRRSYDGGSRFPAREKFDGVDVMRIAAPGFGRRSFAGKLADYAGFAGGVAARVLSDRPRPDLIVSLTTPPFLGLAARWAAGMRGCRHAHWVMDVYPEVMAAHGMIAGVSGEWRVESGEERQNGNGGKTATAGGVAWRVLAALARAELRGSALTLALGPSMAEKVRAHAGKSVDWVPLWAPFDAAVSAGPSPLRAERGWDRDLVLMYSGNMGLGHRFGEFLEAARRLGAGGPSSAPSGLWRAAPRWAFCGGGKRRAEVEDFARAHPEARVELHPYVARERLAEALAAGDVHLASLDSAWQGLMVPSKIQGIFAAARPVIFVGGEDNEIAAWIREAGAGWVVPENDVEALLAAVEQAKDPGTRAERGAAARRFAERNFDARTNVARIVDMLEKAVGEGRL